MIIKEEKLKKKSLFLVNKFLISYFLITLLIGSIFIGFILTSYSFQKTKIKYLDYFSKAGRFEYLYLPQIIFEGFQSYFYKIEKINLEINFDDVLVIENFRKNSIKNGNLGPKFLVPNIKGNLIFEDKKFRGDIRLKGDRKAHFEEKNKSSYKVELDKNQYIFGLKKFSIQKPRIRNYIHEWIFHEMSKDFNIIKLKYKFINFSINGENLGLYVIEEGFGKELIERNKRRNGPIFGIDEDILGEADIDQEINKPIFEIYNKNYWSRKENNPLARTASQKLKNFFNNEESLENVFDVEKWAAYFAVIDMTSTYHGALLKSVKFYYNPINGLFEPIPYDGHRLKPNYNKYNLDYDSRILFDILLDPKNNDEILLSWIKKFFFKNEELNQQFYELYYKNLKKITSKKYIDDFFRKNSKKIKLINSHIYADYFYYDNIENYGMGLYYFSKKDLMYQAKNIRDKLKSKRNIQVLKINNSEILVKKNYKNYGELFLEKVICKKNNKNIEIEINKKLNNFSDTIIYFPENRLENLSCSHVLFVDKFNNELFLFKVDYINSVYSYEKFISDEFEILDKFFFKENKNLYLVKDEVTIDQNLFIPQGYKVIVKPNQKILLTNSAFIISKSPWIIGGKNGDVVISGTKKNLGGGILITDSKEFSKIQNTKISYLTGLKKNLDSQFLILGSINFNQTNVEIDNVSFDNIYSEDAINIFRSSFKITNGDYKNISSDAIDIDFSNGEISDLNFENVQNDAIDFSGSKVQINNSTFNNVNDKLISAGENSKIKVINIKGTNSHVGVVSKDGSEVYSNNVDFKNVSIPFAAYQKKKEYNHGSLIVKNYKISGYSTKWIKDEDSKVKIEDSFIKTETKKIIPIIYEKKLFLLKQ